MAILPPLGLVLGVLYAMTRPRLAFASRPPPERPRPELGPVELPGAPKAAWFPGSRDPQFWARRELVLPLAARFGAAFDVPPSWVMAIAGAESQFKPRVRNLGERAMKRGGAYGLMQVTRGTAIGVIRDGDRTGAFVPFAAVRARYRADNPESLLDPALAVMLGTYYLGLIRKAYRGTFAETAAAYHSGPGALRKARERGLPVANVLGPKGKQALGMYLASARREGIA